ncbi:hypothetical protein V492_00809 [Pseudogymnoascus sp. VKM F-4246]|nr:hypothetical protein V492_00809 [Pseudogymnoascus sp. VKM F-4246]
MPNDDLAPWPPSWTASSSSSSSSSSSYGPTIIANPAHPPTSPNSASRSTAAHPAPPSSWSQHADIGMGEISTFGRRVFMGRDE